MSGAEILLGGIMGTTILGGVAGAAGQAQAGEAANATAKYQALVARQNANAEEATGQRQAIEERRKAAFTSSRIRAVAAASGAGADDPSVLNLEADVNAQGEYNAMSRLFTGASAGQAQRQNAMLTTLAGRNERDASYAAAGGTILKSVGDAATMYAKYG